ncbi:MAG: hypothetical protein JRN45_10865 [Nitrososphaerota archaeon]|nr:hypothetical protein [Nitrososphaerota archaeon]
MPDFDKALTEVCEAVLSEVLGATGRDSTSWWLARSGTNLSDCARRPQEFDDALVEMFQLAGALVIEGRILGRFYRTIGARYERGTELCFSEEVRKAREAFCKRPSLNP